MEQIEKLTCTKCGTIESPYWRGKKAGEPICARCYALKRQEIRRSQKRKARVTMYDWGW